MTSSPNRQPGGSESGGQFAPDVNSESTVDLGVLEVDLGYLFDDVGHPGTILLIPDTPGDIGIAPTQ